MWRLIVSVNVRKMPFEFADISHYTIEILENFPQVREAYQARFHEVMVDEYQDTNHIQERMLELLSNGHNRFMVGISNSPSTVSVRQIPRFSMKIPTLCAKSPRRKLILLKENFRSSSEVLSATNDVLNALWTKRSAKSTMIVCTSLFLPILN